MVSCLRAEMFTTEAINDNSQSASAATRQRALEWRRNETDSPNKSLQVRKVN